MLRQCLGQLGPETRRRRRRTARSPRRACRARSRCPSRTTAGVRRSAIACTVRSTSAPARSILLTNSSVGMCNRCSARIRMRVCGWTPSTAETTSTAPSSTLRTRSTSAMKSGWPGVSIRLTWTPPSANEATADLIVMPALRSSSSESVCVVPASTLPTSSMTPASKRSRSVRVVLPASTCARIPRLSCFCDTRHSFRVDPKGRLDGSERVAHVAPPLSRAPEYSCPIIRRISR